jgi:hypothetical protein
MALLSAKISGTSQTAEYTRHLIQLYRDQGYPIIHVMVRNEPSVD